MDKRTEILEALIEETGMSKKAFAEKIGLPPTTLRSMLERGIGNASVNNVIKICKGLGITIEDLEKRATDGEIVETIAAHHVGDEWTDEELEEIERFKEFVRQKRQQG